MEPLLERRFASANDFDLINCLYSRIVADCDVEDAEELARLPQSHRVLVLVWGASAIIDNGGFGYLLSKDLNDFSVIADAYRTVGLNRAAEAVDAAVAVFPQSRPPADVDERMKYLDDRPDADRRLEELSEIIWFHRGGRSKKLGDYVRSRRADFAGLHPRPNENLEELLQKDLPPPPADASEADVLRWLKSIDLRVTRWSELPQWTRDEGPPPDSGDPVVQITMSSNRNAIDHDLELLTHYPCLRELRFVDLSGSYVTEKGLGFLAALPRIDRLDLGRSSITDECLATISSIRSLESLDMDTTAISDQGLESLTRLPSLRRLQLFRTSIGDAGVEILGRIASLRDLSLRDTKITDEALVHLAQFKALEILHLEETNISGGPTILRLGELKSLKEIELSTRLKDLPDVVRLQEALPGTTFKFDW